MEALQTDLIDVLSWCQINLIEFNSTKCEAICFLRWCLVYMHNAHLLHRKATPSASGNCQGPWRTLETKFSCRPQVNHVVSCAKLMLGLVKRQAKEFKCLEVTSYLYYTLVRLVFEYPSEVWSPLFDRDKERLESVLQPMGPPPTLRLQWVHSTSLPTKLV